MRRREFISLLGGAAIASPVAGRAQQPAMPVIGYLSGIGKPTEAQLTGFRKGLSETGYVEGRNVAIEFRATEEYDQLPALAAELVRRQVAVIYAVGAANSAQAARAATATIPIVFANGSDPVAFGLVASMARPGGNVTGVSFLVGAMLAKRLELLRELVPLATVVAFLVNPANSRANEDKAEMQAAARSVGQQVIILSAGNVAEIESAFATADQQRVAALLVNGDAFFNGRSDTIAAHAARYKIPTSFPTRQHAVNGGLMSYGDNRHESYREAGLYVGRILRGEMPADLPVLQPTKFELVINLRTAKALGLPIPPMLLTRADEVIE